MASIGGKFAKIMYGSNIVAGMGTFSITGFTPDIVEDTAFGDTVKKFVNAGIGDAGKVTFSGNFDPADANGQDVLNTLCATGTGVNCLYFYISTSCFYRVAAGGSIFITKAGDVTINKAGLGTCSFEGQVSGKAMERVGTYSAA
jgi:hypothetical protein